MPIPLGLESSLPPPAGSRIPRIPAELDSEWLTACLQHAGALGSDARVDTLRVDRIGEASGFAGTIVRLSLRYAPADTPAPASLIAKFASLHAPTREMLYEFGAYAREAYFYRVLAAEVGIATPRCYFAHCAEPDFLLLLEDLAPARSVSFESGLDLAQCELVFDQLAGMHARFWNRRAELEPVLLDRELLARMRERYRAALPIFRARYAARCPTIAGVAPAMLRLLESDDVLRIVQRPPLTLAHNDLHVDNLLFPGAEGGRFALLDWQSYSAARHGASDLARVLGVCVTPELRRKHGRALLRRYHERLCTLGVGGYAFRSLLLRVREETVALVTVFVLALGTFDFGEAGQQKADAMADRLERAVRASRMAVPVRIVALLLAFRRVARVFFARLARLGPG